MIGFLGCRHGLQGHFKLLIYFQVPESVPEPLKYPRGPGCRDRVYFQTKLTPGNAPCVQHLSPMAAKLETRTISVRQEAGTNSAPISVGQQGAAPVSFFPRGIREEVEHTGTYLSQNWSLMEPLESGEICGDRDSLLSEQLVKPV